MIDVAIGLVFFYVTLSLVCSSIQEIVAGAFGLRARNLRRGIVNLIGNEYAQALYEHPLVKGLRKPGRLPSYLRAEVFATALLEVVAQDKGGKPAFELSARELRETIARISPYNPARGLLLGLVDTADSRVGKLKRRVAECFDAAMERVAGWYKRQVTWFLLAVATAVTLAVNADTIHIAEQLWRDGALRGAVAAAAEAAVAAGDSSRLDERTELETFPLGYPDGFPGIAGITGRMVVGWLLTIAAISLGAPFWFDLLGRIARLRAAGRARGTGGPRAP